MACEPSCVIALSGAGLALSVSGLRRMTFFRSWLPAWLAFLTIGLTIGLVSGAVLMHSLGYRL
ncbi:MAG TPA: hypothetical protein VF306_12015 [Pirellulales bacterium]